MEKSIEPIDVLIIGSGPAGSSTALHLLRQGGDWAGRVIVVDQAVHPREKLCGGGITYLGDRILADLGLPVEPPHVAVREVRLVYQDEHYSFRGNPVLRIVHRAEFDHWLVREIEKQGIVVRQGEGVVDLIPRADYVEVITTRRVYHARTVVGADGSRSLVRRRLRLEDDSRVSRLLEILTPESARTAWEIRDGVAVFDFSPMTGHDLQGYYWDFPSLVRGETRMNRGVFDSRSRPERPKADLKATLEASLAARERRLADYPLKGHPIRWFHWRGTFAVPRVLLAGDAAGADPLFGEGIAIALAYGQAAAAEIEAAFARQDFSFVGYRRRILRQPVLRGLVGRTLIARLVYRLKSPRLFRLGWRAARWIMRLTRWHDPAFVPARPVRREAASLPASAHTGDRQPVE